MEKLKRFMQFVDRDDDFSPNQFSPPWRILSSLLLPWVLAWSWFKDHLVGRVITYDHGLAGVSGLADFTSDQGGGALTIKSPQADQFTLIL